ncbi:AraC family transcriptional regulator [Paenibacillus sp. HJGM_3]|uniref:AraC family transcriptional regulator n=1 Tax=Paenibacillus sp. HJGM_3 TaxID=3379816 RepID=UPI0038598399
MHILKIESFMEGPDFPFFAGPFRIEAGAPIRPHAHDFVELAYIAEGSGTHWYKGEMYSIGAGDVFVIEPGAEHSYETAADSSLLVYNVLFLHRLLQTELETLSEVTPFLDFFYVEPFLRSAVQFQSHLKLDVYEQMEIKALLDRIIAEFEGKPIGYRILTKTRLIELFVLLSRCFAQRRTASASFRTEANMLASVCAFIEQHYAQPLTLQQVSQLCGMSPSAFSAKFKQHTGKTFIEYRNSIRLQVAAERMRHTEEKLLSISQEVGFDDLSFFNKLFKQQFGLSPGQYRRLTT